MVMMRMEEDACGEMEGGGRVNAQTGKQASAPLEW